MASFNIDNFLRKNLNVPIIKDDLVDPEKIAENTEVEKSEEEWIWVVGYKGTRSDMTAYDNFQYEIDKQYDMPEDAKIEACESGFHFCMNLKDVFGYYNIENSHRFFEVKALVRKGDVLKYGKVDSNSSFMYFSLPTIVNKLAAKSIILVRELTIDEIFADTEAADWSHEYKVMALEKGVAKTRKYMKKSQLLEMGYSEAFVEWLINDEEDKIRIALAVGSQPDLSMDVKVLAIITA